MHAVRARPCNIEDTAFENELDELDSELGYKKFRQVQHRQFLTYDGIGTGTISQRQKAYQQRRLDEALENVFQRKYQKAMANPDEKSVSLRDQSSRKHMGRWDLSQRKLTGAIERLAEDLIQEAIARGDFDNVKGKPLDSSQPPAHFVDSTTYRLNKVLITSGFSPEWATIGREISNDVESLKLKISSKRDALKCSSTAVSESPQWQESLIEWEEEVVQINKKIAKFNLLVPNLMQQKGPCSLQRLISNIIGTI
jgi:DnaJ family protein C protein 28